MLALALLLTGCPAPPDPSTSSAPAAAPVDAFTALGSGGAGADDAITALASRDSEVVAVGRAVGWRSAPTFRRSADGGRTWVEGALDPESLRQTPPGSDEQPTAVVPAPGVQAGWVALGSEDRGVSWTSADGTTWTRHAVPPEVVDPATDTVSDLVTAAGTVVAVGSSSTGSSTTPIAWTSPDGVTWARHVLPGEGAARAAAVRGRIVVAVGATTAPGDARAWRSTDLGTTWSLVGVPRPPGDDGFSRELRDVATTGSGLVALGGAWTDDWEPTLYRSDDGTRWRYDSSSHALGAGQTTTGAALPGDDDAVAALRRVARLDQVEIARRSGRAWVRATTPLTGARARAEWFATDLVHTRLGWLVSVDEEDLGRTRGHLWFSGEGSLFVDVGVAPSRWATGATYPLQVVPGSPGDLVVGRSQGLPVVWPASPSPAGRTPVRVEDDTRFTLDGALAAGRTQVLWGSELGGNSRFACVWTSTDGRTFTRSRAGTFGRYDVYGYSEVQRVRRVGKRWVAVGEQSRNGPANRSALIATSDDGLAWAPARSAGRIRLSDPDWDYEVTDLAGAGDHVRSVQDVVGVDDGLLAVGAAAEEGEVRPAVWTTSRVGGREAWALRRLPLRGFASATMVYAQSRGPLVVVLGTVRRAGSGLDVPYVWRSTDSGATWSGALLPLATEDPARVELGGLVLTDRAFVVVATVEDDRQRPVAWRSDDGRTWSPLPLVGLPGSEGDDRRMWGPVGSGSDLVGVVRVRTEQGSGSTVFRQPVP